MTKTHYIIFGLTFVLSCILGTISYRYITDEDRKAEARILQLVNEKSEQRALADKYATLSEIHRSRVEAIDKLLGEVSKVTYTFTK